MRPHVDSGRIAAMQVGADGIMIPWQAIVRGDEPDDGPVVATAQHLVDWCGTRKGGF